MWSEPFEWSAENFSTDLYATKEFIKNTEAPTDYGPLVFATNFNMQATRWTLHYNDTTGLVRAIAESGSIVNLFTALDAYRFDLTIDQGGRPFVCYEKQDGGYFFWYDPLIPGYTITFIGDGVRNPFAFLDMKDYESLARADVVLTYSIGREQFYRVGSERYTVERQVPGIDLRGIGVVKAGVGKNLRYTIVTR